MIAWLVLAALLWACASPAWAAVSCSSQANGTSSSNVNATSYTTGSIAVTQDYLILVAALVRKSAAPASTPTISNTGTSITWTQIDNQPFNTAGTPLHRITLWRGISSTSQSITVTFDMAGVTHTAGGWSLIECSGVDTATNQGIVQSAKNFEPTDIGTLTVTLAAFGSVDNATAGFFGSFQNGGTMDVESGSWTLMGTSSPAEALLIGAEFRADNDTTVTMSASSLSSKMGGIAVEIKAATAGGPETTFLRRRRP